MRCYSKFDSKCDVQQVDQFGFVDLNRSINEGFVPADLVVNPDSFDGEEVDPESIVGRPRDTFEAMRIQEELAAGIKSHEKSVAEKQTEN